MFGGIYVWHPPFAAKAVGGCGVHVHKQQGDLPGIILYRETLCSTVYSCLELACMGVAPVRRSASEI